MTKSLLLLGLSVLSGIAFGAEGTAHRKAVFPDKGELQVNPTFVNCSVEFGAREPIAGARLEYRTEGSHDWRAVPDAEMAHYAISGGYRTSIRDLKEDTAYELRLVAETGVVTSALFRTWKSDVPIARTVYLDAAGPKVISDRGSPDGWIRYTAKPGTVLDFGEGKELPIRIEGAEYVVLDDMVLRGTRNGTVIRISNSSFVRIRNLEISNWGRVGEPRFDRKGCIYDPANPDASYINYDAAIWIGKGAFGTVVERCYVHDPRGRAHSWYYSHPAGPEAVMMGNPKGLTVIRWNDFVGSDDHRYNDAVEGTDNFSDVGGFNCDADIYGNFMAFCNDDCIEMDGGQRNVRNFDNRYESALCGVSIQGCMVGPTYVYRNAFTGMGDEFGGAGQVVKTGGGAHGPEARAFLEENDFWRDGYIIPRPDLALLKRGNRFKEKARLDPSVPVRPLPFVLDAVRLEDVCVTSGGATPAALTVRARGGAKDCAFHIAKNEVCGWFDVVPAAGVVPAGGEVKLIVTPHPERMGGRRHWRGAFLVRTPDGLSRPVTLYVRTDFVPPYRAEKLGDFARYAADFTAGSFVRFPKNGREYGFDVPKDGRYYFLVHGKERGKLKVSVDGLAEEESSQQAQDCPIWTMLTPGRGYSNRCRHYDLRAGHHTVRIASSGGSYMCDGLVLTDNPLSFEPGPHAADWPRGRDPAEISRRITHQLLSTSPHDYRPKGFVGKQGYGWNRMIQYSVVSLWVNALECARLHGDKALEKELTERYLDYLPGGRFYDKCSKHYHVDDAIFGALPLEVYLMTGDERCRTQGLHYADIQFAAPCEGTVKERDALSEQKQHDLYAKGYSPETRFWIDDMYMITALQSQAFRASGKREYIERAAKEMCLYLDRLQIKEGPDAGLFYHAPSAPFVWARGAGWMAAGMTLVLSYLPKDSAHYRRIMEGYRLMMAKLLEHQRPSGLWGQLVNDAESWDETSGSAMYAYAFIVGTRKGWLTGDAYLSSAGRSWAALCDRLDANANLEDVCEGTGYKNSRDWYMNRARQTGDPHGQAPMLWICRELLNND